MEQSKKIILLGCAILAVSALIYGGGAVASKQISLSLVESFARNNNAPYGEEGGGGGGCYGASCRDIGSQGFGTRSLEDIYREQIYESENTLFAQEYRDTAVTRPQDDPDRPQVIQVRAPVPFVVNQPNTVVNQFFRNARTVEPLQDTSTIRIVGYEPYSDARTTTEFIGSASPPKSAPSTFFGPPESARNNYAPSDNYTVTYDGNGTIYRIYPGQGAQFNKDGTITLITPPGLVAGPPAPIRRNTPVTPPAQPEVIAYANPFVGPPDSAQSTFVGPPDSAVAVQGPAIVLREAPSESAEAGARRLADLYPPDPAYYTIIEQNLVLVQNPFTMTPVVVNFEDLRTGLAIDPETNNSFIVSYFEQGVMGDTEFVGPPKPAGGVKGTAVKVLKDKRFQNVAKAFVRHFAGNEAAEGVGVLFEAQGARNPRPANPPTSPKSDSPGTLNTKHPFVAQAFAASTPKTTATDYTIISGIVYTAETDGTNFGVANVNIETCTGLIALTDPYGRFKFPVKKGSNFCVRLATRIPDQNEYRKPETNQPKNISITTPSYEHQRANVACAPKNKLCNAKERKLDLSTDDGYMFKFTAKQGGAVATTAPSPVPTVYIPPAVAQDVPIKGRVYDAGTGRGMAGVGVRVSTIGTTLITDANGYFVATRPFGTLFSVRVVHWPGGIPPTFKIRTQAGTLQEATFAGYEWQRAGILCTTLGLSDCHADSIKFDLPDDQHFDFVL